MEVQLKAQKMFEELGYKKVDRYENKVSYERITPAGDEEAIDFPINQGKYPTFARFYNGKCSYVFVRELKAINQQCKELGWLDD